MTFGKFFVLFWKTILVVGVFFVTFTSTNILINSYKDILNSEQLKNYIHGGKYLVIGDAKLKILVADTDEVRIQGLSGREKLNKDQAMLFIFPIKGTHGIWMKDMNFPIDIIWLDEKFLVVDFIEDVRPESYPNVFKSKKLAKYVLETSAGFIKENGIKLDDQATFLD